MYHAHAENAPESGQYSEGIASALPLKLAALLPVQLPAASVGVVVVVVRAPKGFGALSAVMFAASNV
jgi:hypothetical protein